jgi:hypothetical protein
MVLSSLKLIVVVDAKGEVRRAQLSRVHLDSTARLSFWIKLLEKSRELVHQFLAERATIKALRRRIHSEWICVADALVHRALR